MSYLFSADRLIHSENMRALMDQGMWQVCDRYVGSTAAYQSAMAEPGTMREVAMEEILGPMSTGILVPDLTLYLSLPVDVAVERINVREGCTHQGIDVYEKPTFLQRVSDAYDEWAIHMCYARDSGFFVKVNANRSPDEVKEDCFRAVDLLLGDQ